MKIYEVFNFLKLKKKIKIIIKDYRESPILLLKKKNV